MLKLKREYTVFKEANKADIKELEQIFFEDEHAYLRGKRLPEKTKDRINKLWFDSPLSKITSGWGKNILSYELEDLKQDGICKHNSNKEYWLKSYMLDWLNELPDIATDDFLFQNIDRRESYQILISKAYEKQNS